MAKRLKPIESYDGMTAVLYGRYSSHAQKDASIEQQFRDNRAFCEAHGITIIGEYADKHMSGTSSKRPEFQRMIRDAAKGLHFATLSLTICALCVIVCSVLLLTSAACAKICIFSSL